MPIYEYCCVNCNRNFTLLQKMGASEQDTVCPECGSRDVTKKFSSFCCGQGSSAPTSVPSYSSGG